MGSDQSDRGSVTLGPAQALAQGVLCSAVMAEIVLMVKKGLLKQVSGWVVRTPFLSFYWSGNLVAGNCNEDDQPQHIFL